MISHVFLWGKSLNPICDAVLHVVAWVYIFPFEDIVFVSLSTMPDDHSKLIHICTQKVWYSCD